MLQGFFMRKIIPYLKNWHYLSAAIIILLILIITILLFRSGTGSAGATSGNQQVQLEQPLAAETLNKTYQFALKDSAGHQVSTISYTLINVQKTNQIIVTGVKATSIQGRSFLVVNIKITNNYEKDVQINAKDYIRLMVNNSNEKMAADINNDPVEIQAISTKYTRLGFPINTTDKNLILQVGEIKGNKSIIKLNLK